MTTEIVIVVALSVIIMFAVYCAFALAAIKAASIADEIGFQCAICKATLKEGSKIYQDVCENCSTLCGSNELGELDDMPSVSDPNELLNSSSPRINLFPWSGTETKQPGPIRDNMGPGTFSNN